MDEDFLLNNEPARELFAAANEMPIFDWHCHLSPKEIWENAQPTGITELMLGGDHYKWRAMRSYGIPEELITGKGDDKEKFLAYAKTVAYAPGNPLHHWTHLELQRYFGITTPLNGRTAGEIYDNANAQIAGGGFTPRELISKSGVTCVFTTDDPADSLEYHALLRDEGSFGTKVVPAFRPDKALGIEQPAFIPWLRSLEERLGRKINTYAELEEALLERIDFFASMGCRGSDHAFTYVPCAQAGAAELESIFAAGKEGLGLSAEQTDKYRTALLRTLAAAYAEKGWAMELHIGPMRNNNTLMFRRLGPDAGFDSMNDKEIAEPLSRFLDSLAVEGRLPKTVLFTLNPKDNYVLGTMLGNFQSDEAPGKIQFGSGWWFNDNLDGMREQMKAFANLSVIGRFIGMVTDSRSFLSYPRHEYFRRIFCAFIGDMVEEGLYPDDMDTLRQLVRDVAYNNAARYFGI